MSTALLEAIDNVRTAAEEAVRLAELHADQAGYERGFDEGDAHGYQRRIDERDLEMTDLVEDLWHRREVLKLEIEDPLAIIRDELLRLSA